MQGEIGGENIEEAEDENEYSLLPLTHAQKRVFYTERFYPGTSISNLGGFARLRSASGLDPSLVVDASSVHSTN